MATTKQKAAINRATKNGGNISKAMVESGYSPNTAHTPQKLTDSKAYQELMYEHGLTDQLLIDSLVSDIKEKPKERTKELELGFKLLGRLKSEVTPVTQINLIAMILEKWGLNDVGQNSGDEKSISEGRKAD